MSSLAEIQEAIEKLTSEDRARLREWFDAQDTEGTDELLAAIDEGIYHGGSKLHPVSFWRAPTFQDRL